MTGNKFGAKKITDPATGFVFDSKAEFVRFRRYMADRYDSERCVSEESCITCGRVCLFQRTVNNAPTVDAVEVVHGRWMVSRESEISKNVWCTACGNDFYIRKKIGAVLIDKMPYCPNCGAKMDGGNEDGG